MDPKLFSPLDLGDLTLPNRIVMAPLTRNRALPGGDVPHALNATYYAQRASAGLIISEGTQISPEGKGYIQTPGIHSDEQVVGWKTVTDAVHEAGGRMFAQLWHVGRISHVSLLPGGQAPVAPSPIAAKSQTFIATGFADVSEPRALDTGEIARVVGDYRTAAENAKAAGFDGVEIHAANGYLIDQFLRDGTNKREDEYGGTPDKRTRFLAEVLEAVASVYPSKRVGVRFSPFSSFNDMTDSDPLTTFSAAIARANDAKLGYVHLVEGETGGPRSFPKGAIQTLRANFSGAYMANNAYDRQMAIDAVESGQADLVAFGSLFIANPDLVKRFRQDAPLNTPDPQTFYGGDAAGYTDYPTLDEVA
ncbi:alkene reductase [Methyloceanibacter methanicus]|uniref:Alkene reductase n=1 Tax=Methyloceanibacter methanicus TaxID=1774968 RepID=A0A1E3W4M6_9HYPH|nr:alkene reductase [Methyloceanibacter methanicus]ODS00775.1 alkene reductase [Methyloceanibacter methanicus]